MANKKSRKAFDFVIGRYWEPNDPNSGLCIYAYGSEVHRGSMSAAKNLLKYVQRNSPGEDYSIYRVEFTRVESS